MSSGNQVPPTAERWPTGFTGRHRGRLTRSVIHAPCRRRAATGHAPRSGRSNSTRAVSGPAADARPAIHVEAGDQQPPVRRGPVQGGRTGSAPPVLAGDPMDAEQKTGGVRGQSGRFCPLAGRLPARGTAPRQTRPIGGRVFCWTSSGARAGCAPCLRPLPRHRLRRGGRQAQCRAEGHGTAAPACVLERGTIQGLWQRTRRRTRPRPRAHRGAGGPMSPTRWTRLL